MKISEAHRSIVDFIAEYLASSSAKGVVMGLSGGLDSSVVAGLAVEALGAEKIHVVAMPYCHSNPSSLEDAHKIAHHLGLNLEIQEITPAVDAIASSRSSISNLRLGNICARVRMIYLYDISAERNLLVVGTGNRTERIMGYFTMWGDAACAFTPLGGLLKTQERELARHMGLPEWIIAKTPTADLWKDQTDEGEMGITYAEADRIIHALFDEGTDPEELIAKVFEPANIDLVISRYESSDFKRKPPAFPELPGLEF